MSRDARLRVALGLNAIIVVVQIVAGLAAHSLGLIADAGHNLTDAAAIGLSLVAVVWARRPPTRERSFGYHRATILAALANAASIIAVTGYISVEAIRGIADPRPVKGGLVVVVALVAFGVNASAALLLREPAHPGHAHGSDLNMRSALLHMVGDAAASLGVALAGTVILISHGTYWLDPAVSLVIGVLIAMKAWTLLRQAVDVLLESTPADVDLTSLTDLLVSDAAVQTVHDLHVWTLSSDRRAMSAHVVLDGHPSLEQAQIVGERLKNLLREPFRITHATFELECEPCEDVEADCLDPALIRRRTGGGPA